MHFLLGALAVVAAVIFWIMRARAAAQAVSELSDIGDDVRSAMRRFGYRRAAKNPFEAVDDTRVAAAAMLASLARLDGDPPAEAHRAITLECRATFRCSAEEATEMAAFGRWLSAQSANPHEALRRLTRRLVALTSVHDRAALVADLEGMMTRVAEASDGGARSELKAQAIRQAKAALTPQR